MSEENRQAILERYHGALDRGAKALLTKKTLTEAELAEIAEIEPLQLVAGGESLAQKSPAPTPFGTYCYHT